MNPARLPGARRISSEGAKNPRMMGYREVARCARCGTLVDAQIISRSKCPKCQQDLRSCVQCVHFDPAAPLRVLAADHRSRVSPKDVANECPLFEARTSFERETSVSRVARDSGAAPPAGAPSSSARKAFDDLFKF